MLAIRPLHAADAPAVIQLVNDLWVHEPTMLHAYTMQQTTALRSPDQRGVAAVHSDAETIVGIGTLIEREVHPLRLLLAVHVARPFQRQGIGTALLRALQAHGDARPWQVKALRRDSATMCFLAKHGFFPIMQTLTGHIDPSNAATQAWMRLLPESVNGCQLVPLAAATEVSRQQFAEGMARVYQRYHAWNPPSEFTSVRALAAFTGADFLADSAVIVQADGRLCGGATLYARADPGAVDLANFGVLAHDGPQEFAITGALVRYCLEWALRQHLIVHFEVDVAYVPHRVIVESAPATHIERDFLNLATG